jgi:hypothetical protein
MDTATQEYRSAPRNVFTLWPESEWVYQGDVILKGKCACGHYVRNLRPEVAVTNDYCLWCDGRDDD